MIKIYQGDRDRLDLQSSLLCFNVNPNTSVITSHYSIDIEELYNNCFSDDIFGNSVNFVVCKVENKLDCKNVSILKKINKSEISMYIIYYGEDKVSKNSKLYKALKASDFVELSSVHDGFGGIREQELGIVKNSIVGIFNKQDKVPLSDLESVVIHLVKYSHYNSILNDIQSWLDIYEVYGENVILDIDSLTEPLNDYFLMSITNAIHDMDVNRLYEYLRHEEIEYASILMILQNMYYNLTRAFFAYKEENYEIDFSDLKNRIPDINKYSIYRAIKYMKKLGPHRIKYIYNYINAMLKNECSSSITYSMEMKLQDLGRVVCGRESILIGN